MSTTSKSVAPLNPESVLWNWISDCTKPEGWIRYSPAIARALDSHVAALVLSYAIHCDGHSSSQHAAQRWFYKPMHEWADELALPLQSVEKALRTISAPWPQAANSALLDRWLTNRYNHTASAVMHYRVNWRYLLHWWRIQSNEYGQLPLFEELSNLCLQLGILNHTSLPLCDIPVSRDVTCQLVTKCPTSEEDLQKKTFNRLDDDDARAARGMSSIPEQHRPVYWQLRTALQTRLGIFDEAVLNELSTGFMMYPDAVKHVMQVADNDTQTAWNADNTNRGTKIHSVTGLIITHLRDELNTARARKEIPQ